VREIVSTANHNVRHWTELMRKSSYRKEKNRILVEGKNLILDLIKRHSPLRLILTQSSCNFFTNFPGEIYLISDEIAKKISSVESPEGCFAEYSPPNLSPSKIQKALILDRLADPGNVGTLLRTALGFKVDAIFLIEPCCDIWNPKTIRAAKGAQFDLPIIRCGYDMLPKEIPLLVADTKGIPLHEFSPPKKWLLVVGNEANGPNIPEGIERTTITIKTPGPIESLNVAVAGGIVLYVLRG
jgi:RNA methyltransferase, TrmH family